MNIKIKLLLMINKTIKKPQKIKIKKRLKNNFEVKGLEKVKDLFCQSMEQRVYEIFITSIIAIMLKSQTSFECLFRAQLENLYLIIYLKENTHEMQNIFESGKFEKAKKYIHKHHKKLKKNYEFLSQRIHPDIEGLKSPYQAISVIIPPSENMSTKEMNEYVKMGLKKIKTEPLIIYNNNAYNLINNSDIEIGINNSIDLYDKLEEYLDILYKSLDDTKIENYRKLWTKEEIKNENRLKN